METVFQPATSYEPFARPGIVPMRYEEYLALPDDVHTAGLVEWVHNEAIFHMPPNINHQNIATFLVALLRFYAGFFKLGQIIAAPVEVKLTSDGPSREPDILFISKENLHIVMAQRVVGAPDLVIEIVSPESVSRDFDEKFIEYQEAGVKEYWIIDPRERRHRFEMYVRTSVGRLEPIQSIDGAYYSVALRNFWLRPEWLWEMPDLQLTFAEIAHFPASAIEILKQLKPTQDS